MKEAFITFYRTDHNILKVINGFSFVRHLFPDADDIYICENDFIAARRDIRNKIQGYDRIYCTICFGYQFGIIKPLLNEKWICGGPAIEMILSNLTESLPCTMFKGTFEEYLHIPLSIKFSDYWQKDITNFTNVSNNTFLHYACTIERGCYWNKCLFCDYRKADPFSFKRNNIGVILAQLKTYPNIKTGNIHLGTSAISVKALEEVIRSPIRKLIKMRFFARADKALINLIKDIKYDTSNLICSIGVEVLCQKGIDILQKNVQIEDIFDMSQSFLEKGGFVEWNIMDGHPFLTKEMTEECIKNIDRAKKQFEKYPKLFKIHNNGRTSWPTPEIAASFGRYATYNGNFRKMHYVTLTPEIFDYNKQIHNTLINSKLWLTGEPFIKYRATKWDHDIYQKEVELEQK